MFGLQWLRNKLDSKAHDSLSDHEGQLILLSKRADDTTLIRASTKRAGYMLGIIPLYRIRGDHFRLSLNEDVAQPIAKLAQTLQRVIANCPVAIWVSIVGNMAKYLYGGMNAISTETVENIKLSYSHFNQRFLSNILSKNQNIYRQKLSEVLKTTGAETLTNSIRKHLGMFLVKVREEEQKRSHQDYVSSGPFALPSNCKFVIKKANASVFIVEQAPQVRTVFYLGTPYRIALPYVVFAATVHQHQFLWMQVFFRTAPLKSEGDELLCPALPNINDTYVACFPKPVNNEATPSQLVEEAIQNYWGSSFGKDWTAFFKSAASQFPQLQSFGEWQNQSKTDSQFVLKLAWQSAKTDVGRLAANALNCALKDGDLPEKTSADALQEYAATLGDRFSREIQEKLHFMVSHSHIEADSLALANEEFSKVIETSAQELKTKVKKLLATPIRDLEITHICEDVRHKLSLEVEKACSHPIAEVTTKIGQF